MDKNTITWQVLCVLQFYISSLWGKSISPNLINSKKPEPEPEPQGAAFFLAPCSRSRLKKNEEPEPAKN